MKDEVKAGSLLFILHPLLSLREPLQQKQPDGDERERVHYAADFASFAVNPDTSRVSLKSGGHRL
jgi:hypothetical protein